jgi:hypothetical protein
MYIPKRYGETKVDSCPFCGKQALIKNPQGIAVCKDHKNKELPELKCMCGEYLMMQEGKFGVFFSCFKCGNINLKKALELNSHAIEKSMESERVDAKKKMNSDYDKKFENSNSEKKDVRKDIKANFPREQTIRSDDPRYFD